MSHSNATRLAALLLLGAAACEGRREDAGKGGMLSDSAPAGMSAESSGTSPGKPAPLPAEPVPAEAGAGGMVEDSAARRAEPGAAGKPVPMPAEPKPGAVR